MHTGVGFGGLKWAHQQILYIFATFFLNSRWPKVTKVPHFLAAWGSKKWVFWCKMFWSAFQKCASHGSEKHIFYKILWTFIKNTYKVYQKVKSLTFWETLPWKRCPKWVHKQIIHTFATFFFNSMVQSLAKASPADLPQAGLGVRALAIRGFEPLIFQDWKDDFQ